MAAEPRIHIGCQSWGYDDWISKAGGDSVFYPRGTKHAEMLQMYAAMFDTIEVDSTMYGSPQISVIEGWNNKTPSDFKFSFKTPREVTHERNLAPGSYSVFDEFVASVSGLSEKLGVILIQLPASFEASKTNANNFREFITRLPVGLRFAIEFREPGWFVDWTFNELAENGVALALVEGPWIPRQTMFDAVQMVVKTHCYIRIMGERDLEKFDRIQRDRYSILATWAEAINKLNAAETFVYIDNYFEGHAPATARRLKELLLLPVAEPEELETQPSLF